MRPLALALALACLAPATPRLQSQRGLTGAAQLAQLYDAIFDAQFEDVPAKLEQTCPPAPEEVCQVLDAVSVWWQIQLDPYNRALDADFLRRVDAAIAATDAWTEREPDRAEAWFYLGGAYGARVQWRVLRGDRVAAARDGKRIKDALEKALELDPAMEDAWFGIGLYHYYADVAPAAAKVLRWLLFLPGGDREKGLQEMLHARDDGTLLRSEADYQLHILYLWYEKDPDRALDLLERLQNRHPRNPHFRELIAQVEDVYQHDLTASLRSWQALLDAARRGAVSRPAMAEARARLGIALQLDRLFETDLAIDHLRAVINARPAAPFGALAQAQLQLGDALDRMGEHELAHAAYRAALAALPKHDPLDIGTRIHAGLRRKPDAQAGQAYRLSIEGWRALERGDLAAATRALARSLALRPQDPVTRYRDARLLQAKKQERDALTTLEAIVAARDVTPPTIYASACVDAARLLERRGERDRAVDLYRTASEVFGADQRTKEAAQRAVIRLTPRTPESARRIRRQEGEGRR